MDYEFKEVESLIRNAIDSVKKSKSEFEWQKAETRSGLSEQSIRARREFALRIASCDKYEIAKALVRFHQQALTNLSDELWEGPAIQMRDKVEFLFQGIEDTLGFLQTQFPNLFNFESKPSEYCIRASLQGVIATCDQIKAISTVNERTKELVNIVLSSIEDRIAPSSTNFSYRILEYSALLLGSLLEMLKTNECNYNMATRFLIEMNHNSAAFVEHYTSQVRSHILNMESTTDQIELLAKYLKEVNQIEPHNQPYNSKAGNVRDWLACWLLEEIQYLETKRNLTSKGSMTEEAAIKKDFKMELDMSVAQFACFIKSFVETGIIQNKNVSELIRFLAKYVKTKRSENISYEGFRMRYYNIENNTKDAVRNLFHTAIGRINST